MPSCMLPWAWLQSVLSIWNTLPLSALLAQNYLSTFTLDVTFPERPFAALVPIPSSGNTTVTFFHSTLFFFFYSILHRVQ